MAEGTWSVLWLQARESKVRHAQFVEMVRALDNESALDWIRENGNAGEVYFVEELGEGCLVRPGEPGADPVIYAATPKETGRT